MAGPRNQAFFAQYTTKPDISAADADVSGCIGIYCEQAGTLSVVYADAAAHADNFPVPAGFVLNAMVKTVVKVGTTCVPHAIF